YALTLHDALPISRGSLDESRSTLVHLAGVPVSPPVVPMRQAQLPRLRVGEGDNVLDLACHLSPFLSLANLPDSRGAVKGRFRRGSAWQSPPRLPHWGGCTAHSRRWWSRVL